MQTREKIRSYCTAVCNEIRFRSAHDCVTKELSDHIQDQRDAYMAQGESEELATNRAIEQMGDAVEIGTQLDKAYRPQPQWMLLGLAILLILLGFAARFAVSPVLSVDPGNAVLGVCIAGAALFLCYFLDITFLSKYALPISLVCTLLFALGLALSSLTGQQAFGTFPSSISHFVLILPFVFALFLYAMRKKGTKGMILCNAFYILLLVFILALSVSFTEALVFSAIAWIILMIAAHQKWFHISKKRGYLIALLPLALAAVCALLLLKEYQWARLTSFVTSAHSDPNGAGFVINQVRDMLQHAQWVGMGNVSALANPDFSLTTVLQSDFTLTALIFNYGYIALVIILAPLALFLTLALRQTLKLKSVLGKLVTLSVLLVFLFQITLFLCANLGMSSTPVLGFPFLSPGNTMLVLNAALAGFMLSVFRSGSVLRDPVTVQMKAR